MHTKAKVLKSQSKTDFPLYSCDCLAVSRIGEITSEFI